MDDYISLYIYGWDKDKEDIKLLFIKRNNNFEIPRYKVSDVYHLSKKSGGKFCQTAKNYPSEGSSNNGDINRHKRSLYNNWPTNFCEAHWTGAIEELWCKISRNEVKRSSARLIDLLRVYSVRHNQYFSHASFAVQVQIQAIDKLNGKNDNVVSYRKNLKSKLLERYKIYLTIEQLHKFAEASNAKKNNGNETAIPGATFEEISPHIIFTEEAKHVTVITSSTLFDALGYTQADKECLYEEFIRLSFPFRTVTLTEIKPLISLLGHQDKEVDIFRALDEHHSGELDIYQFILGLTSMDPLTQHGQGPAEFRCRHIFRYYDEDIDGFLNEEEVTELVRDISILLKQKLTEEKLKASVQNAFKIFGISPPEKVPIINFLTSVGSLRFRGTSLLFRASENVPSIIRKIHQIHGQDSSSNNNSTRAYLLTSPIQNNNQTSNLINPLDAEHLHQNSLDPNESMFGDEYTWNSSGYSLAEHTVKVRRSGAITNATNLLDMERAGEVDNTGLETLHEDEVAHHVSGDLSSNFVKHKVKKQYSAQAFNVKSLPNEILSALRYFEHEMPDKKPMDWGIVDKGKLVKYIFAICEGVKDILEAEPRLLNISSPCYVLGDLHGNFRDLICFEKALWRLGPHLTPASFLFLGDYVDRGFYGIEVVLYLFAQKLKSPNRFFLLRGNHEVREIQQFFSFFTECVGSFGEQLGPVVWEEINKVFDRMPLAAVVDKKIFCIHGGVPNLTESLVQINQIPCPLSQPERESPLAWQIMWNDPVDQTSLNDEVRRQLAVNQGFADNIKRQTAFVFNEEAFDRFLKVNNLTHVIRAHEVKQAGFEIQQRGRLMTVFSSSQYCGMNNEAACVLIHDMRIRIIRVDTT